MQNIKRALDLSQFPLVPRGPLAPYVPILLGEVEQEQRPSGNRDREAIVAGAGLCDSEGERAHTEYAHISVFRPIIIPIIPPFLSILGSGSLRILCQIYPVCRY